MLPRSGKSALPTGRNAVAHAGTAACWLAGTEHWQASENELWSSPARQLCECSVAPLPLEAHNSRRLPRRRHGWTRRLFWGRLRILLQTELWGYQCCREGARCQHPSAHDKEQATPEKCRPPADEAHAPLGIQCLLTSGPSDVTEHALRSTRMYVPAFGKTPFTLAFDKKPASAVVSAKPAKCNLVQSVEATTPKHRTVCRERACTAIRLHLFPLASISARFCTELSWLVCQT